MSLGIGAGDLIVIPTLAWKMYKACKESCSSFQSVATQIESLHTALLETQEHLDDVEIQISPARKERLAKLQSTILATLTDLQTLLEQYESMPTSAQRTWDRLRWAMEDIGGIQKRIDTATRELQGLNLQIHHSSHKTIIKQLNRLLHEVRSGHREGSCISVSTVENLSPENNDDDEATWRELCRELESVGLTTTAISENKDYIITWFQQVLVKGELQDENTEQRLTFITTSSSSLTKTTNPSQSRKQSTASTSTISTSTKPRTSTRTRILTTLSNLFRNDTALLQASSDGNVELVRSLISKGANINVQDRWGWRPLSMAAYGGYVEIAQLLLEAGAEIEYADVDGDGPVDVARGKGRMVVVELIEGRIRERERRDSLM